MCSGFLEDAYADYSLKSPTSSDRKRDNFACRGPECQQAFEQIKWKTVVCAVALGSVQVGHDVINVLYTAAREKDPT